MIKGCSKKAQANARAITETLIDLTGYDVGTENPFAAVKEICSSEMGRKWSYYTFKEWCFGLPSAFNSAVFLYYGDSTVFLSKIYENTPAEAERFAKRTPVDKADDRLLTLCFRVIDSESKK